MSTDFQNSFTAGKSVKFPTKLCITLPATMQAVKSSINTNIKSTTSCPINLRGTSYVAAPQRGLKTQNGRFPCKIALRLNKVCYKVSLCENYLRQSCKAFIGLSIPAEMIAGGRPLSRENLADTDPPPCWKQICNLFSLVTPGKSLINTNRKSTTHFPMSLNEHRTLPLTPSPRVA